MKAWYQSKTLWANLGALVAAVGLAMEGEGFNFALLFPAGMALVNVFLRLITKSAIG